MAGPNRIPAPERIMARIVESPSGCWLWPGAKRRGYGTIGLPGNRVAYTHRVMYEAVIGPIPDGLSLDHLCRVKHCCNPNHLEPVTARENQRRGDINQYANRDSCSLGHAYTPENTYVSPTTGARFCRVCKRRRNREHKRRKRSGA